MRDSKSRTDEVEYFDPVTEEQKTKARLVVCSNAIDAEDAISLMYMLGLHPDQEDDEYVVPTVPSLPGKPRRNTVG